MRSQAPPLTGRDYGLCNYIAKGRLRTEASHPRTRGGLVAESPSSSPRSSWDGDHSLDDCYRATRSALRAVFAALATHQVALEGMILKPNMVLAGSRSPDPAPVDAVAAATRRCLAETVPAAVPGVAFLSGGQSPELSTAHLNAINAMG
ncbi:MAG: class I fructose-bisphosphate aldolase, partial [Acidimicrobiia bacterium]